MYDDDAAAACTYRVSGMVRVDCVEVRKKISGT